MKKILCTILLAAALFTGMIAFADTVYEDTEEHWAEEVIEKWSGLGIVNGDGEYFYPDSNITRGEFATIVNRIFKYTEKSRNIFNDLDDNFYTEHILCLNKQGIMTGFGKSIRPDDYITREEAATLLFKALDLEKENTLKSDFYDEADISDWAKPYVTTLVNAGYLKGNDNMLKPLDNITRAETVKLLDNALIVAEKDFHSVAMVEKICIFNCDNTVEGCTFAKPVIVTDGVKKLSMKNVKIRSSLIIRGENQNSVTLDNCRVDNIISKNSNAVKKVSTVASSTQIKKEETKTDIKDNNVKAEETPRPEEEIIEEEAPVYGSSGGYFGSSSSSGNKNNSDDEKTEEVEENDEIGDNGSDDLFMDDDSENPDFGGVPSSGDIEISTNIEDGVVIRSKTKVVEVIAKDKDGAKIDTTLKINGMEVLPTSDTDEMTSYTVEFAENGEYIIEISALIEDGNSKTLAYSVIYQKAEHGDVIGTATVCVEAFTVGGGYIVAPMQVSVKEDVNCAYLLDELFTQMKLDYMNTGSFDGGFYLSSVKGINEFDLALSKGLENALAENGYTVDKSMYTKGQLSEFDFTQGSGWMYSINGEFPKMGLSEYYLKSGDVLRIQFTLAYGADIGGSNNAEYSNMENMYEIADRTELTKLIETVGLENCTDYIEMITKPDLTQEELNELLERLGSL